MSEGSNRAQVGIVFWLAQLGLLLCVAGVMHLGALPQETMLNLVVFALLGVMLTVIAVSISGGQFVSSPLTPKTVLSTIGGFLLLVVVNISLNFFFGAPIFSSVSGPSDLYGRLLVNILSAICEEDLFFGVYCVGKAATLPDVWVMFLSVVVFVVLHALVYNVFAIEVVLFLAAGRLVFTGLYAVTDHSDPPFIIHIIWNVINT